MREARHIKALSPGIRVVEEWSTYDDPDVRPRVLRALRNWRLVSRVQWTVRAEIG